MISFNLICIKTWLTLQEKIWYRNLIIYESKSWQQIMTS